MFESMRHVRDRLVRHFGSPTADGGILESVGDWKWGNWNQRLSLADLSSVFSSSLSESFLGDRTGFLGDRTRRTRVFLAMWFFIAAVSLYDGYLVYLFQETIWELECNPVGRYLIALDDGGIFLFLAFKAVGTLVCLTALTLLYRYVERLALPVIGGVTSAQTCLLGYLMFG